MNKLRECPFCGSTEIDFGEMTGTMFGWTYCQCENCLAEIKVASSNIEDAIAAWNQRVGWTSLHYDKE